MWAMITVACIVFVFICFVILVSAATSNSQVSVIEEKPNFHHKLSCDTCSNKKKFPNMKKGSRFMIEGRIAEKISDTMYQYTDTMESLYWMARDLQYYQMISEPSHSYESTDDDKNTTIHSEPAAVVVPVPVVIPSPIGTPIQNYNTPAPVANTSHSSHSPSHSSHDSVSSSHSSCSANSGSHSSCSSSSSSSCSSSSCGGSSCGGGD